MNKCECKNCVHDEVCFYEKEFGGTDVFEEDEECIYFKDKSLVLSFLARWGILCM